jgi:hypothetical protein
VTASRSVNLGDQVRHTGSVLEVCAYGLQALELPFPILAFSCFISTFAMTLQVILLTSSDTALLLSVDVNATGRTCKRLCYKL